jgi:hypothetical protein
MLNFEPARCLLMRSRQCGAARVAPVADKCILKNASPASHKTEKLSGMIIMAVPRPERTAVAPPIVGTRPPIIHSSSDGCRVNLQ